MNCWQRENPGAERISYRVEIAINGAGNKEMGGRGKLYRYLMPQARRGLSIVSIVLLGSFLLLLALRVISILA